MPGKMPIWWGPVVLTVVAVSAVAVVKYTQSRALNVTPFPEPDVVILEGNTATVPGNLDRPTIYKFPDGKQVQVRPMTPEEKEARNLQRAMQDTEEWRQFQVGETTVRLKGFEKIIFFKDVIPSTSKVALVAQGRSVNGNFAELTNISYSVEDPTDGTIVYENGVPFFVPSIEWGMVRIIATGLNKNQESVTGEIHILVEDPTIQ